MTPNFRGALALFATVILVAMCANAHADEWTGPDKTKHFIAGAAIASTATLYTKSDLKGFAWGCGIGIAKEIGDPWFNGHRTFKDAAVTCMGAYVGAKVGGLVITPKGVQYTWTLK